MSNNVYANGREIACKSSDGKSICAFPDVCMSPPTPPPTGVPVPYPNTGMASDTTDGSKTVKLHGKEAMLRNKSYFKKSTGDEAATPALKKGVVTGQIQGKVYFNSWSMDVKIEGENVVRHLDLTTHNHGSFPGNTPTWPYLATMAVTVGHPCIEDINREKEACKEYKPYGQKDPCPPHKAPKKGISNYKKKRVEYFEALAKKNKENPCLEARRCMLVPYKPQGRGKKRQPGCCPGQTGHHLIEASAFIMPGTRKKKPVPRPGFEKYNLDRAPCICAEGPDNTTATHGLMHTYQGIRALKLAPNGTWKMKEASETGAAAAKMVFKGECNPECTKAQIDAYHKEAGVDPDKGIVASPSGRLDNEKAEKAWEMYDQAKLDAQSIGDSIELI